MKYIKLFLVSVLSFFVLFTLIGLLFPSHIKTVKAIVVNKEKKQVLDELRAQARWVNWHPFFYDSTHARIEDAGENKVVFFCNGNELRFSDIRSDSNSLFFTMNAGSMEAEDQVMALPISSDSTQTQVMWSETEQLKWYPWERFRGLLLERSKGIYLDTALHRFKIYIESGREIIPGN